MKRRLTLRNDKGYIPLVVTLLLVLLLLSPLAGGAKAEPRHHSTLVGTGRADVYDTYLSPLAYHGPEVSVLHLTWRKLGRQPKVSFLTETRLEYSHSHNPTKTAYYHSGAFRFSYGWVRGWSIERLSGLSLSLGGLMDTNVGGVYNTRNSNNPANARLAFSLTPTLVATYDIGRFAFRYNASLPLFGFMFSPQYGQSYYDIFPSGDFHHNLLPTHPFNALSLRQLLTASFQVRERWLTLGYSSLLLQAKPHHLRQHQYSRCLLIGFTL